MKDVHIKPVHSADSEYGCQRSSHSSVHDTPGANSNSVTWLNAHVPDAEPAQRAPTSTSFSSLPLRVVNHPKLMGTPSATQDLSTIKRKHSGILTRSFIILHNICSHMTCAPRPARCCTIPHTAQTAISMCPAASTKCHRATDLC
jgi:hypothetical protein